MAGPIAVDTPDYQRGVVSAQILLATVPAGTAAFTVGIPPNAETIIVTADSFTAPPQVYCEGTSTLYKYAGVHACTSPLITVADTWAFDVSYPMDKQVEVVFNEAPSDQWYIYADSAARVVFDGSTRKNNQGSQYVIGGVPNTAAGDHPPIELETAVAFNVANATMLLAGPPAGQRIRVFTASLFAAVAGQNCVLHDTGDNTTFWIALDTPNVMPYLPSGLALSNGGGVQLFTSGGGNAYATILFTVEDI